MAVRAASRRPARPEPAAIVGMAARFPGSPDVERFMDNLERSFDAVREIPATRWDVGRYYDPDRAAPGRSVSKWCGVLDGIERFDHRFFNISARDAEQMDPQQRVLLETVWHCLEDAAIAPARLKAGRCAVFVGVMATDYHQLLSGPQVAVEASAGLGAYGGILANRISHALGLTQASVSVDAACASSLVALHQARRALRDGECDHAIVAAVSLNLDPWKYETFSKAGMLSPGGRCRTFDAAADGYVPGDGVAALLLTRESDAARNGDRIHALVLGSAVNHCGETASITHPSADAQERVIREALQDARVRPDAVSYIEAHGTGTALGDPIEVEALNRVFAGKARKQLCLVGSVKSNIGHLEAAAGLAGLVKVVMMLRRRRLVPTCNVQAANPLCRFSAGGVALSMAVQSWEAGQRGEPLRAGVSSFGMGGVNAHVVVAQAPVVRAKKTLAKRVPFLLAAADRDGLAALIAQWQVFAQTAAFRAMALHEVAATLAVGRAPLAWRVGTWAESHDDVVRWLQGVSADDALHGAPPWVLAFGHRKAEKRKSKERLLDALLRGDKSPTRNFVAALARLGVAPAAVTGVGEGLARALKVADRASGDRVALCSPDRDAVFNVPRADADYIRDVFAAVRADRAACEQQIAIGRERIAPQPSFVRQLEDWRPALASFGLDPVTLAGGPDETDEPARALRAVMTACALHAVNRRWNLDDRLFATATPLAEAVALVTAQILSPADVANALLGSGAVQTSDGLAHHAALARIAGKTPMLAARASAWPDRATIRRWEDLKTKDISLPGALVVSHLDGDELEQLALALWLRGEPVDWSVVFAAGSFRPQTLPLYPFQGRTFRTARADFGEPQAPAVKAAPAIAAEPRTYDVPSEVVRALTADTLADHLRRRIAQFTGEPAERIGLDASFFDLGAGSVELQELTGELARNFSGVTPTLLFQHTTIARLAAHLATLPLLDGAPLLAKLDAGPARPVTQDLTVAQSAASRSNANEPIAIIGMSGRFPMAPDIWALWDNLAAGRDCIQAVPPERWERARAQPAGAGLKGGFIDGVDTFEPLFFGISVREAELMDPQQRLALENVWSTMEHAGYGRRESYTGRKVGVFLGTMWNEYSLYAAEQGYLSDAYGGPGSLYWAIANRVSYAMDFNGPSMVVDTACSSSLTAIHLACQALRDGDCAMAIAGGVNLSLHPAKYQYLGAARFLSSDGRCRSFGEGGDGYVPGEGVASVLLKPLSAALADGDRVYGVVLGTSANHGGRAAGFTVPNPHAQQDLIGQALTRANVAPSAIGYVECHGTGTALGDPIEIEALSAAYRDVAPGSIAIGSIKSNIGHLEAAAGVAGLIKLLLAFEHESLPPSLHGDPPNARIPFAGSPFRVLGSARDWAVPGADARHAAISSFGAGGSNAHAIIAAPEIAQRLPQAAQPDGREVTMPLSARSRASLAALCRAIAQRITPSTHVTLARIAATLARRQPFGEGVAIAAHSVRELAERLRGAADVLDGTRASHDGVRVGAVDDAAKPMDMSDPPCSLPGTPFIGESYWLPTVAQPVSRPPERNDLRGGAVDHDRWRYTVALDPADPLVADHIIGGAPVLAGAVAIELARRAVAATGVLTAFSLQGFAWASPLPGGEPVSIALARDGAGLRIQIGDAERPQVVGRAMPTQSLPPLVIEELDGDAVDIAALYRGFADAGLAYGQAFRSVTALRLSDEKASGRLRAPLREGALPPPLLDGAFQMVLAWLRHRHGVAAAVPVGIDAIEWAGALPQEMSVSVLVSARMNGGLWRADIVGFDADRACLRLSGVTLREVDPARLSGKPAFGVTLGELAWRRESGRAAPMRAPLAVVAMTEAAHELADAIRGNGVAANVVQPDNAGSAATIVVPLADEAAAIRAQIWTVATLLRGLRDTTVILTHRTAAPGQRPEASALAGLLRVLRHEMPALDARELEVAGEGALPSMSGWAHAVAAECALERPDDPELLIQGGERHMRSERPLGVPPAGTRPYIETPWLVTGGLGGLGLLAAERLAERGAPAIVLVGRSAEPKTVENRRRLAALRERTRVVVLAADVADAQSCASAVRRAVEEVGPLGGVLHAAGVLRDGLLRGKRADDFAAVLAPKIEGARNLDDATRDQPLEAFVMFASLTGVRGNLGQGDYAYANRFLDLFAEWRDARRRAGERRGRTIAIDWPLWDEGGMSVDAAHRPALVAMLGSEVLSTADGLDAFERCLGLDSAQAFVSVPPRAQAAHRIAAPGTQPPAGAPGDGVMLRAHLLSLLATITKVPAERLDPAKPVDDYGVDSVMAVEFVNALEKDFGALPKVLLYEQPTLNAVAAFLSAERADRVAAWTQQRRAPPAPTTPDKAAAMPARIEEPLRAPAALSTHEPIAIVGLAGRFPGAADLDAFWRNLAAGTDAVTEIPAGRWRDADWPSNKFHGAFLDGVDLFDPLVFGISPKDARLMDPQARLFLETSLHALEDAGYAGATEGRPIGVFAAAMWGQYELLGAGVADGPVPASSFAEIANRVSHAFGMTGPSLAVDSMCSSSLTALHLACESLRRGECEMALAGGVNLSLRPEKYRQLAQGGFLSSDGRCRSFGEGGDGYVPGEGVCVAVLKPLSRARADGDHIWGVIRGSAVNHGGRAKGYTVPNPSAQAAVIAQAFADAGMTPDEIDYIEAHGTGTSLGDPIEIGGLSRVFNEPAGRRIALGSVKSSIGHLEAAAGMAGLAKVLLQMAAGRLAPSLHADALNPAIDWNTSPFALQRAAADWPARIGAGGRPLPRRAVLSSFGAGGSNAHLVIEEEPRAASSQAADGQQVIPLSARTRESLAANCDALLAWIGAQESGGPVRESLRQTLAGVLAVPAASLSEQDTLLDLGLDAAAVMRLAGQGAGEPVSRAALLAGITTVGELFDRLSAKPPGPALRDVAFTLQTGRLAMSERLCIVASSLDELRRALTAWREGREVTMPCFAGRVAIGAEAQAATEAASRALAQADLAALARAFVAGGDIDWTALHRAGAHRVRLPGYAFERKRYWFEPAASATHAAVPVLSTPAPVAAHERAALAQWSARAKSYAGDAVLCDRHGGIAVITLNRPAERNMLGEDLALGLTAALDRLAADESVKALVIAAAGETFSMGGTPDMLKAIADGTANFTDVPVFYRGLIDFPLPVVTAMAGHAYGGGLLFGLYGDMPVLARESLYSAVFADYGFTPGMGATLLLPARLGAPLAGEMMLTARPLAGADLAARGAQVRIVPRASVLDEAMQIARSLAMKPRATLMLMKRELARALIEGLPGAIERERAMHAESFVLPEVRERLVRQFEAPAAAAPEPPVSDAAKVVRLRPLDAAPKADGAPAAPRAATPDVAAILRTALAAVLMMDEAEVAADRTFHEQGLDSIGAIEFVAAINRRLAAEVSVTDLYDHPTLQALAAHAAAKQPQPATPEPPPATAASAAPSRIKLRALPAAAADSAVKRMDAPAPEPLVLRPVAAKPLPAAPAEAPASRDVQPNKPEAIAIVGMAARFPGANDIETFWSNLLSGVDSVGEVPRTRWDADRTFDPDPHAEQKSVSRWGGFLDDVAGFDAAFFGFSPMEAEIMEPQQRIVLEECWRALEEAGIAASSLKGSRCGVFLGAAVGDYEEHLSKADVALTAQAFTGLAPSVHAARIAYALDLTGPAIAIDTACSSSLVAVHQARQGLLTGDCDLALAGGVMVMTTPKLHIKSSQSGMLSPTGRCRPFADDADGIALAEGVGVLVLKRLSDAQRDGDPIHAVIRASGVGQDGRTNGITAPSARAQADLIRRVQAASATDPSGIGYVEAHGTGTPLGDPIEYRALGETFGAAPRATPCWVGSVKGNIGHATTAAGVAGLIKATLAVERGIVPPQAHFASPNARIDLGAGPFRIPVTEEQWNGPRMAAVSSFGFSGTNAHVILEQAPPVERKADAGGELLFVLSARSAPALAARRTTLADWLGGTGRDVPLADVAYTLLTGRDAMEHRFAVVAATRDELVAALRDDKTPSLDSNNPVLADAARRGGRRCHLPPYVFDHVRYWIEPKQGAIAHADAGPFVASFTRRDRVLAEHVRGDAPILPGAAYVTFVLDVAAQSGLAPCEIRDLVWRLPFAPPASGEAASLTLSLRRDGDAATFSIVSETLEDGEAHARGSIIAATPRAAPYVLAQFLSAPARVSDHATFYAAFDRKGLHLGPSFRRVASVRTGDGWALAEISARTNGGTSENDPGLLDSALQGVSALIDPGFDDARLYLPVGLDRFVLTGALADARWSLIHDRGGDADGRRFDIVVFDGAGKALAMAEGFRLRAVEGADAIVRLRGQWHAVGVRKADAESVLIVRDDDISRTGDRDQAADVRAVLAVMPDVSAAELFARAAAIAERFGRGKRRAVTLVTRRLPAARALAGFARSLALENSAIAWRVVLADDAADRALVDLAADQSAKDGGLYRLRDGMLSVMRHAAADEATAQPIDGTWIVSGGFGRLGLLVAERLAQRGARPVLIGRNPPGEDATRRIAAMQAAGARPVVLVADLADQAAAIQAVSQAHQRAGTVRGVVHCAGTLRDGLLANKTADGVSAVLGAKVDSAENLWRAVKDDAPRFIVFSSIAAVRGHLGQTDYAFANGWLDGLAEEYGSPWQSIAWSWWRDGGMALPADAIEAAHRRDGLAPIETKAGLDTFERALGEAAAHTLIVAGQREKIIARLAPAPAIAKPDAVASAGDEAVEALSRELGGMIAALLKVSEATIAPDKRFEAYGFDSITLTRFAARIARRFDCDLSPAVFFEENTVAGLARLLIARYPAIAQQLQSPASSVQPAAPVVADTQPPVSVPQVPAASAIQSRDAAHEPIAIIGMAGRFPGSADLDAFWDNLSACRDLITEIPPDRWDWREFYGAIEPGVERTNSKWGGFLTDVDRFDAKFFGVSPREAELMDPQQRLFLETVWHAIEDAGLQPSSLAGSDTGLFVGVSTADYLDLLLRSGARIEAHTATGLAHSMMPNRISYLLDLHGPSEPVDTACSSSLIAIARAVDAIRRGDCRMALAGGVNLILSPTLHLAFGQAGMLSPTGRCRPFDAAADGYVRGEGVGAVLLKPLSAALADNDPIHGVIRAIKVNHGGRASSLTAPNPKAQAALVRSAIADAGIEAGTIGYVETHGTGTPLGDPVEINGLTEALRDAGDAQPLRLGALKANIGHLEAAAGVAGLIKVLLAMRHGVLPGHPHFKDLNPHIRLDSNRFVIQAETAPWPRTIDAAGRDQPRRAGLSSFGFGGAYAHAIVEEFVADRARVARDRLPLTVFERRHFWADAAKPLRGRAVAPAPAQEAASLDGMVFAPRWQRLEISGADASVTEPLLIVDVSGHSTVSDALMIAHGRATRIDTSGDLRAAVARTRPRHVVFVDADRSPDSRDPEGQIARRNAGPLALFRLVRALLDEGHGEHELALTVLTAGATDVAGVAPARPSAAAALGFCLCVAHEQPRWRVRVCDLGDDVSGGELTQALARLEAAPVVSALTSAGLWHRVLVPASSVGTGDFGKTCLLLGGAGGIGRALAVRLAQAGTARLVLAGRRAEDAGIARHLAELSASGAKAEYVSVDASDPRALTDVLRDLRARGGIDTIVNATMVLAPSRIGRMDENDFLAAFDAKAKVAIALDHALDESGVRLRAILHMSSVQSFVGSAGQANYAAGCSFLDAWALGSRHPAKLVNWGYWGSVGAVATDAIRREMEAAGNGSIEPAEGHAALLRLLGGTERQLVIAKGTATALARLGVQADDAPQQAELGDAMSRDLRALEDAIPSLVAARLMRALGSRPAPGLGDTRAWATLLRVAPQAEQLFTAVMAIVAEQEPGPVVTIAALRERLPSLTPHLDLLEAALEGLPDVLSGAADGASVVLPGGSMKLVESVYTGNALVDAANRAVADDLARMPGKIRVLEIGAGTGGATRSAAQALAATGRAADYCYTDVSRAFLHHGERTFGADFPFMRFALLDIERDPPQQGFAPASFDFIVAANVLHATRDLDSVMRHARSLLAPGGRLALIELTSVLRFNTVTFGLLPGWWRAAGDARRLPMSPLLDADGWRAVLAQAGFDEVTIAEPGLAVSVITARAAAESRRASDAEMQTVAATLTRILAQVLRMPPADIDAAASFVDLGVDSILAGEVAQGLGAALGIAVKPTELFNHPSVEKLARHLAALLPEPAARATDRAADDASRDAEPSDADDALLALLDDFERADDRRKRA